MILSKSCQYSVRALLYIVVNSQKNVNTDITEIAEELNIPKPYLAKIMQQLAKRGLVRSTKGPKGGFNLSAKEKKLTLLNVIEAVDGLEYFSRCGLGLELCNNKKPCPIHIQSVRSRDSMKETCRNFNIVKNGLKVSKGEFVIS